MSSDHQLLDVAAAIGRRIVDDAVWYDGRCSWVGARRDTDSPWRAEYRALEANLYDGTAGVGLFLAELAAVTDDTRIRRTAAGAMRQAAARAPAIPPNRRDGLYAGLLGVAWATARAASLLDDDELRGIARAAPELAAVRSTPDRRPDVTAGRAGAIIALLALAAEIGDARFVDDAVATGDELIATAAVTSYGWSWRIPGRGRRHMLCGLSHGAAGLGWALLELFAATGAERFRHGAHEAFRYEHSWLDGRSGAWPDLRISGQRRSGRRPIPSPAVGTWCHGEGGIALTRLRAIDVLDAEWCRSDAEIALEMTRHVLADTLADDIRDLSLCHGAAGAADVLMCGAQALGGRWVQLADVAPELASLALERYSAHGRDWPCGAAAGTTPGLFRGLSGIGWWFLRLHDRAIPSPLTMPVWPLTRRRGGA
jgi:lantibiotic modifying enzyme